MSKNGVKKLTDQLVSRHRRAIETGTREDAERVVRELAARQAELEIENRKLRETGQESTNLRAAVEQSKEAIFIADTRGIIHYANPALAQMTGYRIEELIGRSAYLLAAEGDEHFYEPARAAVRNEVIWTATMTGKKKDGSLFAGEATVTPIRDAKGNITATLTVSRDVTREKELERELQQSQKMEAIGTLAGGIAHDFNNMLSAIIGFSEIALEELPQDQVKVRRFVEEIYTAGVRARDLIKMLLTFSRKQEIKRQDISINAAIEESMRLLRASVPSTIAIRRHMPREGIWVSADPIEIEQVIMNLGSNAAAAMEGRAGTFDVSLGKEDVDERHATALGIRAGRYARLVVKDTGSGMEPHVMEHIFEPYYTTKGERGTGMGLSVVHGIVRALNGAITVRSTPGRGSAFLIYLPEVKKEASDDEGVESSIPRGRERILFVDDEKPVAEIGKQELERLGYQVEVKTDGPEALKAFTRRPGDYDLVIADQAMPHIPGIDLARRMLKIRQDIPIIIHTGFGELLDLQLARAAGVTEVLTKPVTRKELADTVRRVLDRSKEVE